MPADTEYPPYDANSPCVKCGNKNNLTGNFAAYPYLNEEPAADSAYGRFSKMMLIDGSGQAVHNTPLSETETPRELIKRTCRRCGYVWYERPLDSEKEEPDATN